MQENFNVRQASKLGFRISLAVLATGVAASCIIGRPAGLASPIEVSDTSSDAQNRQMLRGDEATDLVEAVQHVNDAEQAKAKAGEALREATDTQAEATRRDKDAKAAATQALDEAQKKAATELKAAEQEAGERQAHKKRKDEEAVKAQEKLDQATTNKQAADSELAGLPAPDAQALADAQNRVKTAEDDHKKAIADKATADQQVKEATSALQRANSEKTAAETELTNAKTNQMNAAQAVTDAQTALDQAQTELDALSAGTAAQDAKTALDQAKNELETAKSNKGAADQEVTDAKKRVDTAQNEVNDARTALNTLQEQKKTTDIKVGQAETALRQANDKLNQAKAELKKAQDAKAAADQKVIAADAAIGREKNNAAAAQRAKNKADDEVRAAEQDKANKETAVKTAQQKLANAQASVEASKAEAQAQWNKGSEGFFTKMGSQRALNQLKTDFQVGGKPITDWTKIGDSADATSLENMKIAIEIAKKGNELRAAGDNNFAAMPELKFTDELMAIAQINANYSRKYANGHSGNWGPFELSAGENLAWGLGNHYNGWYTGEKKLYDTAPVGPKGPSTGHYVSLMKSTFLYTGFAHRQGADSDYGAVDAQVFWGGTNDTAYTYDEYYSRFMAYYNGLKDAIANGSADAHASVTRAQQELKDAQDAVDQAVKTLSGAQNEAKTKTDELSNAKQLLKNAEDTKKTAVAEQGAKQQNVETAQTTVTNRTQDVTNAENALTGVKTKQETAAQKVTAAQNILNDKQNSLNSANQALVQKQEIASQAAQAVKDAEAVVSEKQAAYDAATSSDAMTQAKAKLEKAQANLAARQDAKTVADRTVADAEIKVRDKAQAVTDAETAKSNALAEQRAKANTETVTQSALTAAQNALKPLSDAQAAHDQAQEKANIAKRALEEATAAKKDVDEAAKAAATALTEANTLTVARRALFDKLAGVDADQALADGLPAGDVDFQQLGLTSKFAAAVDATSDLVAKTNAKQVAQDELAQAERSYQLAVVSRDAKRQVWQQVANLSTNLTSQWIGADLVLTGYGFLPEEKITLELHSVVLPLGETVATSAGAIRQQVTIPVAASFGEHLIVAKGQQSGLQLSVSVNLLKQATENPSVQQPTKPIQTRQPATKLPRTGASGDLVDGIWITVPIVGLIGARAAARRKK